MTVIKLNMAITTLCAWLVPHIGIAMAEFRISLDQSDYWRQDQQRLEEAKSIATITSIMAILWAIILYTTTAIFVSLSTQDMDQRADYIVIGLARLLSAVLFTLLSVKIPKWLGVYHSIMACNNDDNNNNKSNSKKFTDIITVKHLKFHIRYTLWRHFAQVYILMMLQFCNAEPETVPVSALIGIVFGLVVVYGIYIGRTKYKGQKQWIALALAGIISICASLALVSAVYFIDTVWKHESGIDVVKLFAIFFCIWLLGICLPLHALYWHYTKQKVAESHALGGRQHSYKYKTKLFAPSMFSTIIQQEQEQALEQQQQPRTTQGNDNEKNGASPRESKSIIANSPEENGDDDLQLTVNDGADAHTDNFLENETDEAVDAATTGDNKEDNNGGTSSSEKDGNEKAGDEEAAVILKQIEEMERTETTMRLIRLHCCCGGRKQRTCLETVWSLFKWSILTFVNCLFLYIVIVNIGATREMAFVRAYLPPAIEFLYPPEYNIGPVCAWSEPTVNGTIQTFATAQDAYNANYSVVHCGACGSCSNWNDLSIQWTTRTHLAQTAQECAKASFMGTENDVQTCNMEQIGFTNDCAWCWTEDSTCAKTHCVFIYLQGVLINNIGNFHVGLEHITSASCDEAMCGPVFVPCSGATRRRMNIVSAIPRPIDQQCHIIKQDWAKVFNHS